MDLSFLLHNASTLIIGASILSIAYGLYLTSRVLSHPRGDEKMNAIADAITEGAAAYMKRQYMVVALIGAVIFVILYFAFCLLSALGFAIGAIASAVAGVIGMSVAVRANIRTAQAAKGGLTKAFALAFSGGAVTGLMVAGLALLSLAVFIMICTVVFQETSLQPLIALGFGSSLISVFARLGGGIYTKGADVGTDMVGKIEKGSPEHGPRQFGVIFDLGGDNVGAGLRGTGKSPRMIAATAVMT